METVQKAVRDAADGLRNLAFGEQTVTESAAQHGEEPVSGVQGRGTPTDPYDAGNRDEQPDAPQTQDNTAVIPEPLESITPIELKPTDVSSAHSTSDQGAGTATATALPVAPAPSSASHSQPESTNANANANVEPGPGNPAVDQPSPAQEQSNPTASSADTTTSTSNPSSTASSSKSNSSNTASQSESQKPAPEQRDQSQTMPKGEDNKKEDGGVPGGVETGPPTTTQNVSVEALKGPQGPAPRDAYEFEKEMDGQPSNAKSDEDAGEKGGDSGNTHRKMGHMKERLGKVFKHGNR